MTWDGRERRKKPRVDGEGDHDLLIRIDANLSNFMRRFEDHERDDNRRFTEIFLEQNALKKFAWLLTGAFILSQVLITLFGKNIVAVFAR